MTTARGSRGFWPLRDLPVVVWLVATLGATLVHPFVPAPRWLMIHLLLLGAVTHAIMVWSRYFADALLHTPSDPADRRDQSQRLLLLNGGVVAVVAGVLADAWVVTLAGATAVTTAVVWHGVTLALMMRRALPSRFAATVRYYIAAACLLPIGVALGTVLARGLGDPAHGRVMLAHAVVNVLGWMGLTVMGTLVTLWPTMLRTRIAEGAESAATRGLLVLVAAITVAAAGALVGQRLAVTAGLAGYLAGIAVLARPAVVAARGKPPVSFATWSVAAAVAWLAGSIAALALGVATADSWAEASEWVDWLTPFLAAGFGAQVLLGALSYLVPVALGGGPTPVRAANAALDRGSALRITMANGGLLLSVLPVPSLVRVLASMLVLLALAAFIPLLFSAIRASRRAKGARATAPQAGPPAPVRPHARPKGQLAGLAAAGLSALVLATAAGVAIDPAALGNGTPAAAADVAASGETTKVQVRAHDMRFTPDVLEVPAGDRLVIVLENTGDSDVHDLVLDTGDRSGRLSPGETARIDVGVVGRDLDGWCSVVGHRQLGMVLTVKVTGERATRDGPDGRAVGRDKQTRDPERRTAAADLDFLANPGPDFTAHPAVLPPLTDERVRRYSLTVRDTVREVSPGVTQRLWTYNGTAPGPVLHGRVGDVFEITLQNDGSIGHSIDFHAAALAPARPTRTIAPGESLVFRFTAAEAGVWMYHCATAPTSAHIANGLFGAVVIEPPDLPAVDRSYVLVQSELYLGPQGQEVDTAKIAAEQPDAVVFNGYANQYAYRPLPAQVGERVRIWVLDAGPNRTSSFHVVGGRFDTVYQEGAYQLQPDDAGGSQVLGLTPAQGGFVELVFPEAGDYPFVSHLMVDAERGARGMFEVTTDAAGGGQPS